MDDDYGADESLLAAMAAAADAPRPRPPASAAAQPSTTTPIRQPPVPQALPQRQSGSTILVSPRQRGNPVLTCVRSMPWEYSDIPADYVLGITTCALFLSLKYHRLHPEYIYTRIRNLQGKYNLRVLLTMVDIPNHEDSLRELSKTSMVNNVTIILCWSAAEAARYIELYKSYENASFAAIRGQQASTYADRLVDFVTVPRSLNKSDAVALVANFGSLKNAVNAEPEQLGMLNGWGGVKVKRWCAAIDEPFRAKKAAKRGMQPSGDRPRGEQSSGRIVGEDQGTQDGVAPKQFQFLDDDGEDDEALLAAALEESRKTAQPAGPDRAADGQEAMSGGVAAALARLRENG
ncbi:binding domain of DNA repair protein ercc1 (rad10/Swi10) [Hirsutella rhossiliensis]|uniref:Binding domain of DNA repair protein ercc1 (Rad10/Swi10) n=1 Tax=Hirsutella rhossiliensis TaxID=111463 RepID=A0A9P8MNE7_9HYPO|nr:binding domain of DNA repair protein ercc1 (rad10/Swi10) [Hirsutella rhossiliensis]KAH0958613.1 binding domain of DNA repair protein ercc1 (rad10/Swi10) [Hirsutella rhossiliensis]